jgi:hypothetical protein
LCYRESEHGEASNSEVAKMAEQDDVTTCGICSEPFKNGDVAVQAARCRPDIELPTNFTAEIIEKLEKAQRVAQIRERFWAHPVCLFSLAREAEGPASRVAAMPPEPPDDGDEALSEKRKPK